MKVMLVIPILALIGCNGSSPNAADAKVEPAAAKKSPNEVRLDAAAQKHAGLAIHTLRLEKVAETTSATGQLTVNEDQTWSVGAMHNGRIVSIAVKVGDSVKEDQVLANMHTHDVHDSRASYKRALSELARLKAAEMQAKRLHDRASRLLALKAMSQQEVEMAEAEYRNAQAAVRNAQTEVDRERTHLVEYLEVPLEEATSGAGDFAPIKAPASGILIERKATPGSVVSTGQEVFRITTPASVWMLANVNEADLAHLRIGQAVRVLVRAYPGRVFTGRILRLGEELDATTRTLRVRVLVPNPGGLLKPEMYASAEIEHAAGRDALFIPDSAPQELNGNRVVFVRTAADRFEARPVQTGRTVNGNVEVLAGLRAGDEVVAKGSFVLKSQLLRSSIEEE